MISHLKKINVTKKNFYVFLVCITILTILLLIQLAEGLVSGIQQLDNISDQEYKIVYNTFLAAKIVSYVTNSLFAIGILIYLILGTKKIKLGYFFFLMAGIIFLGMAVAPHVVLNANDNFIRSIINILISIFSVSLFAFCLYSMFIIRRHRKMIQYELMYNPTVFKKN